MNPVEALYALLLLVLALVIYRAHRDPHNPLSVAQWFVGPDGKLSRSGTAQFLAMLTSTWAFVHLTLHDKLTEWYFTGYMLAWAGAYIANKMAAARTSGKPPEGGG